MSSSDFSSWIHLKEQHFKQQQYTEVTSEDIEEFVMNFLWKKKKPTYYIEAVNDIMAITPNQFFDYQSLKIQTSPQMSLSDIDFGVFG